MHLTHFHPNSVKYLGKNNSSVNIRFVAKPSYIRNFYQNIRSGNTGYMRAGETPTPTTVT